MLSDPYHNMTRTCQTQMLAPWDYIVGYSLVVLQLPVIVLITNPTGPISIVFVPSKMFDLNGWEIALMSKYPKVYL